MAPQPESGQQGLRKPIFDPRVRDFLNYAPPDDTQPAEREDGLSVGVDAESIRKIREDERAQKAMDKAGNIDLSTVLSEGEPVEASVAEGLTPSHCEIRSQHGCDCNGDLPPFASGRSAVVFLFDAMNSAFYGTGDNAVLISEEECRGICA